MTLQEAIQSGRPFTRKALFDGGVAVVFFASLTTLTADFVLDNEDVLATDWELEPIAPVTLTVTVDALAKAWDATKGNSIGVAATSPFFKRLVETLKAG